MKVTLPMDDIVSAVHGCRVGLLTNSPPGEQRDTCRARRCHQG